MPRCTSLTWIKTSITAHVARALGTRRRITRAACFAAILAAPPASAATAEELTVDALASAADHLELRGLPEQARETWQRVLLVEPGNPEALAALVALHARRGETAPAKEALAKLETRAPGHAALPRLRVALELGRAFDARLADARALVRAGLLDEAARRYHALFVDAPPRGLAAEYWETIGATTDGWARAHAALDALVRPPARPSLALRLAHARLSTLREETRRDGLRALGALTRAPEVTAEALAARRRALLWLDAKRDDEPLYREHLTDAGPDHELEAKRANLSRRTGSTDLRAAFRAIDDAALDRATELLERSIAERGRQLDALVGLGVVALREQDFARARGLFEEVKARAPKRPELWTEPLATARTWALFHQAAADERERRTAAAATKLEACLAEPGAPAT
ncbi:hypothetical protein L6R52_42665, partial [Myxococcota bacterium]|nr:hypothetical protein [Myxococcota bacterium]